MLVGLAMAILIHLYDNPDNPEGVGGVVGYAIVVLLCIYAFGYACSWV